jgi:hypothetical protein
MYIVTDRICPAGMTQDPSTKTCYIVVSTSLDQVAAMAYCAMLHPGVHLIDLQKQEEVNFVNSLVETTCPACKYSSMFQPVQTTLRQKNTDQRTQKTI